MSTLVKILIVVLLLLVQACFPLRGDSQAAFRLDDFEDGDLRAPSGLSWVPLADDLVGGSSRAGLEVRPGGAGGSRHALRLTCRRSGRRGSFAGAWVPLDRSGRPADIGAFEGVRLRLKGPGRVQVGFRSGMVNHMAEIGASGEWRLVEVPFASLAPQGKVPEGTRWSPEQIAWFGITTPPNLSGEDREPDEVVVHVDDVEMYGRGGPGAAPVPSGTAGPVSVAPFAPLASIPGSGWVELASDPERDGNVPALPDATRLEAIPAGADGRLWVRIGLREAPHDRWMGVNVALDVDGDPGNGQAWWGANGGFKFDRLVTVWCIRVEDGCQGYIGVADAAQVASGAVAAGGGDGLRFAIDRERSAFVVGVPRDALGPVTGAVRLVGAVGSALIYADDVPGQGAAVLR
jgi:hypothetical protein